MKALLESLPAPRAVAKAPARPGVNSSSQRHGGDAHEKSGARSAKSKGFKAASDRTVGVAIDESGRGSETNDEKSPGGTTASARGSPADGPSAQPEEGGAVRGYPVDAKRRSVMDAIARVSLARSAESDDRPRGPPRAPGKGRAADARVRPTAPHAVADETPEAEPPLDEQEEEREEAVALPEVALPRLTDVQERLRHVRVGPSPAEAESKPLERLSPAEQRAARERLSEVARAEHDTEVTLAEQLGLKVRRVVIDAGHGGHDTGAIGKNGTREKDVSLAIARRLAQTLEAAGLEVVLTRPDDRFVRLEDRVRLANQARGDLFVSIHCNSAPNRALRGVETYTLNIASDRYSIRLAARENASSEKGLSDLQFILADLATKANTEESQRLARTVQRSLVGGLRSHYGDVRDLGTKQALFFVLLGSRMPSILVETSFLSHPEEERRLASKAYQDEVASSIAAGIHEFIGQRSRLAKVD